MPIIQNLPVQCKKDGTQYGEGFCSPNTVDTTQVFNFLPERVIPIIFLPGIMGTHLRMTAERQNTLKKKNNIAWRPDNKADAVAFGPKSPEERQLYLDPKTTEVDSYDPEHNPTGNRKETADERHANVKRGDVHSYRVQVPPDSPLLMDDPVTMPKRKTAAQKARERGWSEVFFSTYGEVLNTLEVGMNAFFRKGWLNEPWRAVVNQDPAIWQAHGSLPRLTTEDLKKISTNCYYPVHACGYNWLRSVHEGGKVVAKRIEKIMAEYQSRKFKCEKVIIVTHSMGGLVARAICHPDFGNLQDKVLGIVHGVMPAMGSGAGYRRMRAGFEGGGVADWIIGNQGHEVTPVLANAPGGLQLLPSEAYGNDWLKITKPRISKNEAPVVLKSLPEQGDPYEEIYKKTEVWWGLLREEWINPANLPKSGLEYTKKYLDQAKKFHRNIASTYHPISYALYGADPGKLTYRNVTWELSNQGSIPLTMLEAKDVDAYRIENDSLKGKLGLQLKDGKNGEAPSRLVKANLLPPADPGDQTVPVHSAEHQLQSGKFKGIFRQTGYEHQGCYKDKQVLQTTLYSVAQIALHMEWTGESS